MAVGQQFDVNMSGQTQYLLSVIPLLLLLTWAAIEDWRTRRIRNWLTLSIMLSGFLQTFISGSQITPGESALGFVVGLGLPLALFLLGAIGGGDVKLLAAIGAWLGATAVFKVFCAEAVIGMVIVLCQSVMQGRLRILGRNSAALAMNLIHLDTVGLEQATLTGQSCRSIDRPLPFAVPVLIAVIGLVFTGLVR
jgi:prepilin peptidase CpaA